MVDSTINMGRDLAHYSNRCRELEQKIRDMENDYAALEAENQELRDTLKLAELYLGGTPVIRGEEVKERIIYVFKEYANREDG